MCVCVFARVCVRVCVCLDKCVGESVSVCVHQFPNVHFKRGFYVLPFSNIFYRN